MLSEARREAVASAVRAVVFVGDAMEEKVDELCAKAGELGLLKVPDPLTVNPGPVPLASNAAPANKPVAN